MIRMIMLASLVVTLLGCGLFAQPNERTPTPPSGFLARERTTPQVAHPALPVLFHGDTVIEQKILNSNTIVRATMTSLASEVIARADGKYKATLKFNLAVSEYLKGTGPSNIVAIWVDGSSYDTTTDAEDAKQRILSERDTQWDDREAIIFLYGDGSRFGGALGDRLKQSDHFLIYVGAPYSSDDLYSLHSRENKMWLPSATVSPVSGASSTSDDKTFLLDVPSQTAGASISSSIPAESTITLGGLKKRIGDVTDEFNGGDGSNEYKQCVTEKYNFQRASRYFIKNKGMKSYANRLETSSLSSGQPANTVLYQTQNYGNYPDQRAKTWFEGDYAALFSVTQAKAIPYDINGDGKFTVATDGIEFTETFNTTRPLPAGKYKVVRKEVWATHLACNFVLSYDWTVTVTAPTGAIHEAFFDPVKLTGGGIGADKYEGTLKPTAFTLNGTAADIQRIVWRPSGQVAMDLDPSPDLFGHVLEFIGLDGKTTLSLDFAKGDGVDRAPSWQVCDPPWKAGDLLMIRISASSGASASSAKPCPPTATPTPTITPTPTATPTITPTPTATPTPTITPTPTFTPTPTPTFTPTPSPTATPTVTPTPTVPSAPQNLQLSAQAGNQVTAAWSAPSDDGGGEVTGYKLRYRRAEWNYWIDIPIGGGVIMSTSHTFNAGRQPASLTIVEVAAVNAVGAGAWTRAEVELP